ncbi:alpha/beta hydrolase [Cyanobacteria bacterium FACHB-DQ100]|uniref:alpha/beta fold hydrolase n=1 Tax=Leptolyngbya sp. DQ-M1 TaxID=2933920 RepID=UPI0019BC5F0E|nr:alpha/beta hydrolase [Cyanobacteria bacterium FACHB-DQ100]
MLPEFLPASASAIEDADAIALLQQLQRRSIQTSLESETIEIATAYVYAACEQSTTPIVLLPGFDSSLLEFRRLFPHLAAQYSTWTIDLIGFGFTSAILTISICPQTIRKHLLSLVQTWIAQPVILVGASLGGAVAIDFALHHPNWVQSLVLIDSVGFSGDFPIGQWMPRSVLEFGADWLHFRKQAALSAALAIPGMDLTLIDALRCSLLHQAMPGWKEAIVSFSQSGGYTNLDTQLGKIQHPTLILWGTSDDVLGTKDATRFQEAISNSELIWIEKAGHVPHFDQSEAVAAHLSRFVHQVGN